MAAGKSYLKAKLIVALVIVGSVGLLILWRICHVREQKRIRREREEEERVRQREEMEQARLQREQDELRRINRALEERKENPQLPTEQEQTELQSATLEQLQQAGEDAQRHLDELIQTHLAEEELTWQRRQEQERARETRQSEEDRRRDRFSRWSLW